MYLAQWFCENSYKVLPGQGMRNVPGLHLLTMTKLASLCLTPELWPLQLLDDVSLPVFHVALLEGLEQVIKPSRHLRKKDINSYNVYFICKIFKNNEEHLEHIFKIRLIINSKDDMYPI